MIKIRWILGYSVLKILNSCKVMLSSGSTWQQMPYWHLEIRSHDKSPCFSWVHVDAITDFIFRKPSAPWNFSSMQIFEVKSKISIDGKNGRNSLPAKDFIRLLAGMKKNVNRVKKGIF